MVKLFLVPGSIGFLVLGLAAGLALLYGGKRTQRWGRIWLAILAAAYAVLATPIGSNLVVWALARGHATVSTAAEAPGVETIVVLSTGGEVYRAGDDEVAEMGRLTAFNAMEAARLFRLLGPRTTVVASGGIVNPASRARSEADVLAEGLVRLGVPRGQIVVEPRSRTTREQAVFSAEILARRGVSRFVLVTTVDHMPRAQAAFRARSLQPIPSPSVPRLGGAGLLDNLRPAVNALRQSEWAAYEYLSRAYYWMKGWV
ncbi:MAG: YdcF family protein [Acidobacteria bacterium]|nr:MAG: YdcF family protein [Acidobacteriota bacterium]